MPDDVPTDSIPGADAAHRRSVRSFVVRAGRMTVAQERAWHELWPRYGIDWRPVWTMVGSANGESVCPTCDPFLSSPQPSSQVS